MKKLNTMMVFGIIAFMVLSTVSLAANYETPNQKSVRIKNTRYDPFPVEPGSYFDIWIRVENFGSRDIENFKFKMVPEYPFSLDPNEDSMREIGLLEAGSQVQLRYKVRTDINAVEGMNPLHYEYATAGVQYDPGQFNIDIYTLDPILTIKSIETDKDSVAPGEEVEVSLTLKNLADSILKDVNVKMNFIDFENTATGVKVNELPISPIGSGDERTVKIMEGGAEKILKFNLIVNPSAESTVYKIPTTITYNDMQGENYSKSTIVSLIVGSEPDLAVTIDSSTARIAGSVGEVIVKFVNKGFSEIKFLYVTLEESDDYEIISPRESYLGNIDSDDYESAEYDIYVTGGNGNINLPITIEYRDTNNNQYKQKIVLENRIYSSSEAKKLGIIDGGGYGGLFLVILIVGGGLYGYRRWKKKKKK